MPDNDQVYREPAVAEANGVREVPLSAIGPGGNDADRIVGRPAQDQGDARAPGRVEVEGDEIASSRSQRSRRLAELALFDRGSDTPGQSSVF